MGFPLKCVSDILGNFTFPAVTTLILESVDSQAGGAESLVRGDPGRQNTLEDSLGGLLMRFRSLLICRRTLCTLSVYSSALPISSSS